MRNQISKIYQYYFYRIYALIKRLNSKTNIEIIAHNAILFVSFTICMAVVKVFSIITSNHFAMVKVYVFILLGCIYMFNLIYFYRINNHRKIENNFCNETKKAVIISAFLTIAFALASIIGIIL